MFDLFKRSPQAEHHFCQENLSPLLDGQLTPREQARAKRHLQQCSDCRADLESLRQTVTLLHGMPAVKPPRSFFIPASAGVRQRQVQRTRLAYGYLQFATAVAGVLLVLVVSSDALLRLGTATPARQAQGTGLETTFMEKSADTSAPEVLSTPPPEMLAAPAPPAFGAAAQQSPEATMAAMLSQPVSAPEAGQTETAEAVADSQELMLKAAPSQTFARPAGAPPMPTATQESTTVAPPAAELTQPSPTPAPEVAPTREPPTATPLPTETPVPVVELPSPQPVAGEVERHEPPPRTGARTLPEAMQPVLPWLELTLALVVAVGLATMLWLHRKQRLV